MSALRRFLAWLRKPVVVEVKTTRSPDWEGDAARYRKERGW